MEKGRDSNVVKNLILAIGLILSCDYVHKDAEPDVVNTMVKIEVIENVYVGAGFTASIDSSIFSPNKVYSNPENVSIGIAIKF